MSFLSVLFAYLLSRHTHLTEVLQHDTLFNGLLARLSQRFPNQSITFWLAVPATSLLAGALVWYLPYWLAFLATLTIVVYGIGRHHCQRYLHNTLHDLHDHNAEALWLRLQDAGMATRDEPLWHGVCRQAVYNHLNDLFAALFWFCLLGPTGILFYRFLAIYNQRAAALALPSRRPWQEALDWLPARYMGLCFCLAGDFANGVRVWRELFFDTQLASQVFLQRCADAAAIADTPNTTDIQDAAEIQNATEIQNTIVRGQTLQALLNRTEIIGIVGLALVVLLY